MLNRIDARLTRLEALSGQHKQHGGLFILPADVLHDPEALARLMRENGLTRAVFLPAKEDGSGLPEYSTVKVLIDDESDSEQTP